MISQSWQNFCRDLFYGAWTHVSIAWDLGVHYFILCSLLNTVKNKANTFEYMIETFSSNSLPNWAGWWKKDKLPPSVRIKPWPLAWETVMLTTVLQWITFYDHVCTSLEHKSACQIGQGIRTGKTFNEYTSRAFLFRSKDWWNLYHDRLTSPSTTSWRWNPEVLYGW